MKLTIDYSQTTGPIKAMNAANNGPVYMLAFPDAEERLNNLEAYRAANIPYARTHDASFCPEYGEEHTVDTNCIFTDFDADPEDPAAYDFHCTDYYLRTMLLAGTKPFYRLGCKIEGLLTKHYAAHPPKDFQKWAVICEHIIAHYNEGWADGFHMDIEYWEIWNEPNSAGNWTGTMEQYYDLYATAAGHLKTRFPHIKIGGPASCCYDENLLRDFLLYMRERQIPVDFCSWHSYAKNIADVTSEIYRGRALLDSLGYMETETNIGEWNYAYGWGGSRSAISREVIQSTKGAAFTAAYMAACQYTPVDMLMYYDLRPHANGWNGAFDDIRYKPRKGYYPLKAWGELRKLGDCCAVSCGIPDIYAASAKGEEGEMTMIAYYTDADDALPYTFTVEMKGIEDCRHALYLLDDTHDMTKVAVIFPDEGKFTLTMEPNTVVVVQ